MIAVGAGAVASAALRVLWGALHRGDAEDAPDQIAALTAQSVANAARASIIEAVEGSDSSGEQAIGAATAAAIREAARAGADVTAAAIGAVEGARIVHREAGLSQSDALAVAQGAAVVAAEEVGPTAAERVRRILDAMVNR